MSFQPRLLSNNFTSIFPAEIRKGMALMTRIFHKQQEEGNGPFSRDRGSCQKRDTCDVSDVRRTRMSFIHFTSQDSLKIFKKRCIFTIACVII